MSFLNSQKLSDFALKAFENGEKDIEISYNTIKDELAHMAKRIKNIMKFNKKFYKNQESRKEKRLEKSSNEKGKGSSKGKKIECFNYGGQENFATDSPSPKYIKKSM